MASTRKVGASGLDGEIADNHERESLLNNDDDQDEDALYNDPRTCGEPAQVHGSLDSIKIQIREVTEVMRDNVEKVLERGDRMEDLRLASDRLSVAGAEFRHSARKARQDARFRNLLAKSGPVALIVVVFVTILVTAIVKYS